MVLELTVSGVVARFCSFLVPLPPLVLVFPFLLVSRFRPWCWSFRFCWSRFCLRFCWSRFCLRFCWSRFSLSSLVSFLAFVLGVVGLVSVASVGGWNLRVFSFCTIIGNMRLMVKLVVQRKIYSYPYLRAAKLGFPGNYTYSLSASRFSKMLHNEIQTLYA